MFFGCGTILKNDPPPITDINNDGYDDDDIMFINKLIENSQTGNIPPDSDLNPLELGTQTWVEGRLRSIKHTGGSGGFFLYLGGTVCDGKNSPTRLPHRYCPPPPPSSGEFRPRIRPTKAGH